jgi:hypothetical protein
MADEETIRTRAHLIWEREGRPEGRQAEHWEQARRELENEDAAAAAHGLRVTPDNDPTRPGGPVSGGPGPAATGGGGDGSTQAQ